MPLITQGIQAGIGAIGAGKAKKEQAKAPEGMPEGGGGEAGAAKGADGAGAAKGEAAAPKEDPIDRFLQMLNSPNIKSIGDIKNFRDQVLQKMQGLAPDKMDNAKKKLNQAILQKLGIGQPGPNGSISVNLTPQNQQILQQLGMQPDQVTGAGGAQQPGAAPQQPGAQQPGAAPPMGAAPQPAGPAAPPGIAG